jgi:D-inositol-3-phosphate glycosyltransferase
MTVISKKILIVAHHYPPHITGVGNIAHNQAKRLVAMGHTVTVVTSETNSKEKSSVVDGVSIVRVKAINIFERWNVPFPIFYPSLLAVLSREVKKADIVHIHDAFYMSSFFAGIFARMYKKIIVLTAHIALIAHPNSLVVAIEKLVYATTGKLLFNLSKSIIVYNDTVEQFLLKKGISQQKIVSIINGVDTAVFHPVDEGKKKILRQKYGLPTDKKIILFVGRYVFKKGFTKVLAAASEEYHLVFVGGDSNLPNTSTVTFLEKLSMDTVAEMYQLADVFILPSESEGFPLSIQEAMASGLPVITSDDKGYARYSLDRHKIYLLNDLTEGTIRTAIQDVINDEQRLMMMRRYSRDYAVENFDWGHSMARLEKLYLHLISEDKIMDIAFVSDAIFPFNKGGKERRLYDITTRLASRGHRVTIYCMKWWDGPRIINNDGVTLHAISRHYGLYTGNRRSILQAILFSSHCFKLLTKKFDVVEVDHIPHLVLFVMKIVCTLRRKRFIATWHEVWGRKYWKSYLGSFLGSIAYRIERISARLPDKIISVSLRTTHDLMATLKTRKEIITIPNAVDIDSIANSAPGVPSDVIFAGRLLPHKHVDTLLMAIAELKQRGTNLMTVIVGDGVQRIYLEGKTKELGIEELVTFTGFFERQDQVYGMMKSSRVLVLPSTREGFGIAVIEANSAGIPVVTIDSDHNASKDLIIEGQNGIVCALDEKALASAIIASINFNKEPSYYREYVKQYDWKEIINKVEESYYA